MPKIYYSRLKPGLVIEYLLRPDQLPTCPTQVWRGKITRVYFPPVPDAVDVLDEGYEGLDERVFVEQIIHVERVE